ncbi:hypothetical protein IAF10_19550, partial [Acinetobacter baumannii]|nr:hypothetical protein [Acinetobacter baumannii]
QRAGHALLPKMHLIDLKIVKKQHGISQPLIEQIKNTLARKEQDSLVNVLDKARHHAHGNGNLLVVYKTGRVLHLK